jgi:hypothetical protein
VSNFAIEELVLIYVQKKETKDLNAPAVVPSLTAIWQLLVFARSLMAPFLSIKAGTCAHVDLF